MTSLPSLPALPPPSPSRPALLAVYNRRHDTQEARDRIVHRLHDAAVGLQAATGTDVSAALPGDQQLHDCWQDAETPDRRDLPHGEVDLREEAGVVIALLTGPTRRPIEYSCPVAFTLANLLERYQPALLWTDDFADLRLIRPTWRHAQLMAALDKTPTVAGDNRDRRIDPRPAIEEEEQRLRTLLAAHQPARRRGRPRRNPPSPPRMTQKQPNAPDLDQARRQA